MHPDNYGLTTVTNWEAFNRTADRIWAALEKEKQCSQQQQSSPDGR